MTSLETSLLMYQVNNYCIIIQGFTLSVQGVGDVCSFAEMNLRKHGHPDVREMF